MNRQEEFRKLIRNDERTMRILEVVRELNLPDWFVAAGAIRNTIWDIVENFSEHTALNDIDVVYFDPSDTREETENKYEKVLSELEPKYKWSVTNQVRMADYHNDPPYKNSCDAIAHWIEECTCIGVRLEKDNSFTLCAPFGVDCIFEEIVRINPKYPHSDDYERRKLKKWDKIWPNLRYT